METSTHVDCKIFYVDDDRDDLELFKDAASMIGEEVCIFDLGELLIHALHNPPPFPTIVMVDLNMPTKSGFEVIGEIKEAKNLRNLPIIVYSTASDLHSILQCREMGVSMYIIKPTSMTEIRDAIQYVLEINWSHHKVTERNFLYKKR